MAFSKLARLSILGTALVGVLGVAAPGQAQTAPPATGTATPPAATPPAKPPTNSGETIVVTGSRIKHSTFNSPSPITVITAEDAELTGNVDTSHILQLTSVANNAVQINNEFSNFVVTGGPGINTLSLRGIGAQRTLILIDGQRMGPAGVSGSVGPIDLNTIPASIIDHVDILNDGASSIYGSDAVAGVVNIITKKNLDGAEIHLYGNPTEHAGGDQYQMNAAIGKTFDRGYINAAFDVFQQDPLTYKQRPYLACSRDVAVDATTGASADVIDPKTGQAKCWNLEGPDVIDYGAPNPVGPAGAVFYAPNSAATLGGGLSGQDINGFQAVDIQPGNFLTTPTTAPNPAIGRTVPL
jgi:iron complex outermembrane receptor protein